MRPITTSARTVCDRTYKTWTSRVSSINWKHFCFWKLVDHGASWLFAILRHRNTLTYLLCSQWTWHTPLLQSTVCVLLLAIGAMTIWRPQYGKPATTTPRCVGIYVRVCAVNSLCHVYFSLPATLHLPSTIQRSEASRLVKSRSYRQGLTMTAYRVFRQFLIIAIEQYRETGPGINHSLSQQQPRPGRLTGQRLLLEPLLSSTAVFQTITGFTNSRQVS